MSRDILERDAIAEWLITICICGVLTLIIVSLFGCATGEALVNEVATLPPEAWACLLVLLTYFFAPRA